jgi:tetratricopeptide (TPR) repeat protein
VSSEFPRIPEDTEPLPAKLYQAVQSLQTATAILESGEINDSAVLFSQSTERVAMWLADEGHAAEDHGDVRSKVAKAHTQRRANLARVLGVSDQSLKSLSHARSADGYGNLRPGGEPVVLNEGRAMEARDSAGAVFSALVSRADLLTLEQRSVLDHLLSQPASPRFAAEWIDAIEEAVFLGKHAAQTDDHLAVLLRRYLHPQTRAERLTFARLALLTATRARNQGRMQGPDGALAWTKLAMRLYERSPDPFRVGFLLRVRSIAFGHLGNSDAAWDHLQLAYGVAGSDDRAIHLLRNQEAVFLMREGRLTDALRIAEDLVAQAEAWGDQDQWTRRLLTLGRIKSRMGALEEAEVLIKRSVRECPREQIIVHAVAELSLANTYARSGVLDKLYTSAKVLGSLVRPYGLPWQAARANTIIQAFEGSLDCHHLEGEDDVF